MDIRENPCRFDEPSGQGGRYSKIERIFQTLSPGYSLKLHRTERFDQVACLLYSPVEYIAEDVSSLFTDNLPDDEWILSTFLQFVKGEFGSNTHRMRPESFEPIETIADASFDAAQKYLENCEAELVYGGILQNIIARHHGSTEDAFFEVISAPLLGNPANRRYLDPEYFISSIAPAIKQQKRIQFLIPSFPFKDQNIFRTEAPPDHVDLGEIALMIRLHTLSLAFFQIHPFGADWIILADGVAYAEALGIESNDAIKYRENLRDIRNRLNLQGTVSILDLAQIARYSDGDHHVGRFDNTVKVIANRLKQLIELHVDVEQSLSVLVRGIIWNLSTRCYENKFSRDEIWQAVTSSDNISTRDNNVLAREIYERGVQAALYYGSYNIALRYYKIPQSIFPQSLRATVHPKRGQLAIPSLGDVYPWNGIPVVLNGTFRANDIMTAPWYALCSKGERLTGHLERGNHAPLYYTKSRQ